MKVIEFSNQINAKGEVEAKRYEYEIDCITEAEAVEKDKVEKAAAELAKQERQSLKAKLKDAVKNPPKKQEDITTLLALMANQLDILLGEN